MASVQSRPSLHFEEPHALLPCRQQLATGQSVNAILIFTPPFFFTSVLTLSFQVHVPLLSVHFLACLLTEILGRGSKYIAH